MTPLGTQAGHAVANWLAPGPVPALAVHRLCVDACARAYSEYTLQSDLAHILHVESPAGPILACRGSASIRDWFTDARVSRTDLGFASVHSGFWQSANSIFPQVLKLDQTAAPAPVILTGHSKGAAEALILTFLLVRAGRPVIAAITFGGPRVGDARWRTLYNNILGPNTHRWIHEEDIVPRLPVWLSGYRHVGQEYFISSLGGAEVNPPLWRKGISDLWGTFYGCRHRQLEQIIDHPINRYQKHLYSL